MWFLSTLFTGLSEPSHRSPHRDASVGDGPIAIYRRWCRQFYSESEIVESSESGSAIVQE